MKFFLIPLGDCMLLIGERLIDLCKWRTLWKLSENKVLIYCISITHANEMFVGLKKLYGIEKKEILWVTGIIPVFLVYCLHFHKREMFDMYSGSNLQTEKNSSGSK